MGTRADDRTSAAGGTCRAAASVACMGTARAIGLFVAAGLAEIGGYLMWRWLRDHTPWPYGLVGALILVAYGVIPTLQHATFGRTYAAYGGVFVIMRKLVPALGWGIDGNRPGTYEWIGAAIITVGVGALFFAPRH